jgi:predicted nucleotidyltransferase
MPVPDAAWESLGPAFEATGVKFAFAFGSRERGEERSDSDLDLAVMCDGELSLLERSRLAETVASALDVPEVDLVVLSDAPLELRAKVIREGRLVYSADEPARVAFQVQTLSRFLDFEPTLRMHERRLLKRFAERGLGGSD